MIEDADPRLTSENNTNELPDTHEQSLQREGSDNGDVHRSSNHSFGREVPPPPPNDEREIPIAAPKSTGNPLKDMLNAQIRSRSSMPQPSEDADYDDDGNRSRVSFAPSLPVPKPQGAPVNSPIPPTDEEEEAEEDDLFATQDDPYSLFGTTSRVTSQKFNNPKAERDSLADLFGDVRERSDSMDSLFGTGSSRLSKDTGVAGLGAIGKRTSVFGADDDKLFDEVPETKPSVKAIPTIIVPKPESKPDTVSRSQDDGGLDENDLKSSSDASRKQTVKSMGAQDLFGSEGLFGGIGDTDDLFATAKTKDSIAVKAATSSKFSSLFGDDDDDDDSSALFASKKPVMAAKASTAAATSIASKPVATTKGVGSSSLFGEDDNDDSDLFGGTKAKPVVAVKSASVPAATTTAAPRPAAMKKASSIFDDDDDDDDDDLLFSKSKTAAPVAVVTSTASLVNKASTAAESKPALVNAPSAKRSSIFDEDDEEDSLFRPSAKTAPIAVSPAVPVALDQKKTVASKSIFGDDDDDVPVVTKAAVVPILPATSPLPSKVTQIFDDAPEAVESSASSKVGIKLPIPSVGRADQSNNSDIGDTGVAKLPINNTSVGRASFVLPVPARRPVDDESDEDDDNEWKDDDDLPKKPIAKASVDPVLPIMSATEDAASIAASALRKDAFLDSDVASVGNVRPTILPVDSSNTASTAFSSDDNATSTTVAPAVTANKVSGGLAARMVGLDASKIVMPGQAPPPKVSAKASSLFGDEDEDLGSSLFRPANSSAQSANANMNRATVNKNVRKAPKKKLFSLDDDDDDPLFGSSSTMKASSVTQNSSGNGSSKKRDLFGDDSDDFSLPGKTLSKSSATVPSSSNLSASNDAIATIGANSTVAPATVVDIPVVSVSPTRGLFEADNERDSLFSSKLPISSVSKVVDPSSSSAPSNVKRSALLDDDDENEDGALFTTRAKLNAAATSLAPSVVKFAAPDVMAIAETAPKKSVFADLEESNDLFASRRPVSEKIVPAVLPQSMPDTSDIPTLQEATKKSSANSNKGLFGDDDDDLLFGSKEKPAPSAALPTTTKASVSSVAKKSSIFGDDDDDDDALLFSNAKKTASPIPAASISTSIKPAPASLKKQTSLFGDDDDDPLFGGGSSKKQTGSTAPKSKSLFDD